MAEEIKETAPQDEGKTPRRVRSEKYTPLYINQMLFGFTSFDIQMSLMQVHGEDENLVAEEIASLTMSPQHAKAMVIPLINCIAQYEKKHGVVAMSAQQEVIPMLGILINAVDKLKANIAAKEAEKSASAEDEAEAETNAADQSRKPPVVKI